MQAELWVAEMDLVLVALLAGKLEAKQAEHLDLIWGYLMDGSSVVCLVARKDRALV